MSVSAKFQLSSWFRSHQANQVMLIRKANNVRTIRLIVPNLSSLACVEVSEKFLVGCWVTWLPCLTSTLVALSYVELK